MTDNWLAGEQIEVNVDSLMDFATHIKDELDKNFKPSFENGIRPMLMVQAPFGGGSSKIEEGALFRTAHADSSAAAAQMMSDVMRGLMALAVAATSIQAEYLMGDAFAEAESDTVLNAFNGGDGQKTLQDYYENPPGDGENQPTDPNIVTEEQQDPENYDFENNGGDPEVDDGTGGGGMYDEKDVGGKPGDAGYYHIEADDENMHDDKYDLPTDH